MKKKDELTEYLQQCDAEEKEKILEKPVMKKR
jgi:hypothetical protein